MDIHIKALLGHYSTDFESNGSSKGMAGERNVLSPIFPHHLFSHPKGNLVYLLQDEIEIVPEVGDDVCR